MNASDWHAQARALKTADPERSNGSIARELGVTRSAVWKVLHPDITRQSVRRDNVRRASAKRAWENAQDRGTCACGRTLMVGARRRGVQRCRSCYDAERRASRLSRAAVIERLWRDGCSMYEIAAAIGTTRNFLSTEMVRLRREGLVDLPLRRRPRVTA